MTVCVYVCVVQHEIYTKRLSKQKLLSCTPPYEVKLHEGSTFYRLQNQTHKTLVEGGRSPG